MDARSPARELAVLALAVLAAYAGIWAGTFQFDDYNVIVDNENVHGWTHWSLRTGLAIRPLLKASYVLDWAGEDDPLRYHATNLAIHLANAVVVWALARAWLRAAALTPAAAGCVPAAAGVGSWASSTDGPLRLSVPLATALLFALHPAQTEAVTYICGRSTSLMALAYGLALLAYAHGREARTRLRRTLLLAGAVPLLMVAALGVKETAITLPLALLLWERACGGRWRDAARHLAPVALLGLVATGFILLNTQYLNHLQRSAELNSLEGNLGTQALAHAWLMGHALLPLWPNIDPDLPLQRDLHDVVPALLLLAAVPVAAVWAWHRHRRWSFALAWWWLHLVPLYLFFPRLDVANERQLYLAAWPLALALAGAVAAITERDGRLTGALRGWIRTGAQSLFALILIALAVLTMLRNRDYASEIALWEQTVRVSPGKARAHNNLGYAYMLAGRPDDARREYRLALQLDPSYVKARMNLLRLNGRLD